MLNEVGNAFMSLWTSTIERIPSIVAGLVVFVLFYIGSRIGAKVARKVAARTGMARNLIELLVRIGAVIVIAFGVLFAAVIIFPSFKLGDEIVAGDYSGRVEEITARSTRIHTYDGERAVTPNADVYTQPVLVRTAFGKRRAKFTVGIGYPDSIEKARDTIMGVLKGIDGLHDDPGPWVYVNELAGSSVNLTVYFWTDDSQRELLRVSDRVATGIKLALDQAGIDMPFPTRVVLFHDESKAS